MSTIVFGRQGSVKLQYYVWAPYNPNERLTSAVRKRFGYFEDFLEIGYPYRSEGNVKVSSFMRQCSYSLFYNKRFTL